MILRPSQFAGERGVISEFLPTMYLVEYTKTIKKMVNGDTTDYSKYNIGDTVEEGKITSFVDPQYIVSCKTNESNTIISEWVSDGPTEVTDLESVDKFYKYAGKWVHVGKKPLVGVLKNVYDESSLLRAIQGGLEYTESQDTIKKFEKSTEKVPDIIYINGSLGKVTGIDSSTDLVEYTELVRVEYQKEETVQYTKSKSEIYLFGLTSTGNIVYIVEGNGDSVIAGVNGRNHQTEIPKIVREGSMTFSGKSNEPLVTLYAFITENEGKGRYCPVISQTQPLVEIEITDTALFSKKQIDWESEAKLLGTLKDTTMKTNKIISKIHKHANIEIKGTVYTKHLVDGKKQNFERIHYVHNDALYTTPDGSKRVVEIVSKKGNEWLIRLGNESKNVNFGSPNLLIYSDFKQLNPHLL
jgi:hypothetical protein